MQAGPGKMGIFDINGKSIEAEVDMLIVKADISPSLIKDLTNKIDVGSQPGTMWSLSSQKPGHGLAELRDPDFDKLWQ